jgi:hypothetical protein
MEYEFEYSIEDLAVVFWANEKRGNFWLIDQVGFQSTLGL